MTSAAIPPEVVHEIGVMYAEDRGTLVGVQQELYPDPPGPDYAVLGEPALAFTVYGAPVGQGALSFLGKGRPAVHSNRKTLYPWRNRVRDAALAAIVEHGEWIPLECPVAVDRYYTMPRPASRDGQRRPHPVVNSALNFDIDHLDRAVFDAMKGTVYVDDALIVGGMHWKAYPGGHPDCPPEVGVTIRVYPLET